MLNYLRLLWAASRLAAGDLGQLSAHEWALKTLRQPRMSRKSRTSVSLSSLAAVLTTASSACWSSTKTISSWRTAWPLGLHAPHTRKKWHTLTAISFGPTHLSAFKPKAMSLKLHANSCQSANESSKSSNFVLSYSSNKTSSLNAMWTKSSFWTLTFSIETLFLLNAKTPISLLTTSSSIPWFQVLRWRQEMILRRAILKSKFTAEDTMTKSR